MEKNLNSIEIKEQNMLNGGSKSKTKSSSKGILISFKKYYKWIILVFVIFLIILALYFVFDYFKYKKYEKFEEKMRVYGFDKLYDNESCKTKEFVNRSEAVKVIIGTILNTYDIDNISKEDTSYNNATWAEYANDMNLVKNKINKENCSDRIRYGEAIYSFYYSKEKFLKDKNILKLNNKDIKDIKNYSSDEQVAIKDFVNTEIIELSKNKKIKGNQYLVKGLLNELVINIAEKYETINLSKDDKLNINKDNIPSNVNDYPYTLSNVKKEIYEIPFDMSKVSEEDLYVPAELYKSQKNELLQASKYIEEFYNVLLNVDYETINFQKFKSDIKGYTIRKYNDELIKEYIKYLKDNKIKLKGNAEVIMPVFYYDGMYYRIRTKLNINVLSSDTDKNLIFGDYMYKDIYKYESKKYEIYADFYMTDSMSNSNKYIVKTPLYKSILNKDSVLIKKEVNDET